MVDIELHLVWYEWGSEYFVEGINMRNYNLNYNRKLIERHSSIYGIWIKSFLIASVISFIIGVVLFGILSWIFVSMSITFFFTSIIICIVMFINGNRMVDDMYKE